MRAPINFSPTVQLDFNPSSAKSGGPDFSRAVSGNYKMGFSPCGAVLHYNSRTIPLFSVPSRSSALDLSRIPLGGPQR